MRIGLDARKLRDGGIGTYIRHLLRPSVACPADHQWVALLDPRDLGAVDPTGGRVREVPVEARKYGFLEHLVVPRAARSAGVELLHAPHYTLPLGWTGAAVVTIHDLIPLRFPRFFPPGAPLYVRAVAGSAANRARLVLVDSLHARREIVERLGVEEAKIRVIPLAVEPGLCRRPGVDVLAFRTARGLPADYLLYVGARKRHKNLALVLEALACLPGVTRPPLVLSGPAWDARHPLARQVVRLGLAEGVHFAGDLDGDADLACLYSGAALYLQPSLTEGFGLPPLEAMACGTPVLSSDGGALPEVLGDAAVVLPPAGAARWAEAISGLLTDTERRATLVAAGHARAARFTLERFVAATHAAYDEAMGTR